MSYSHSCRSVNSESSLQCKNFGCRVGSVVDGKRLSARMSAMGISQSELARRVGVAQQTIYKLISGASRGSAHLHRIARELATTPAYLTGETDDPSAGAQPLPPPGPTVIMMGVVLPPERALAQMFEGLLRAIDLTVPVDALARELAELLPTGLSQLQGPLHTIADDPPPARAAAAATLASADREPR